eukprot:398551_1
MKLSHNGDVDPFHNTLTGYMQRFLKASLGTAWLLCPTTKRSAENTDVLIIGGGIVGSSAAYCLTLQAPDLNVTLIERNHIGSGASSLSAGTLHCCGYGNYSSILSTFCMDTINILKQINDKGHDIEFIQNGALQIAVSDSQSNYLYQTYRKQKHNGYDVEYIDSTARIQQLEPNISSKVISCIHTPQSGHVDPGKATVAIAEQAQKNGTTIYQDTNVINIKAITNDKYKYIVETECGKTLHCNDIIIASGAWSSHLYNANLYGLNIKVPVIPVKGQIWMTEPAPLDTLHKVIFISESHSYWECNSTRDDENDIPECCTHDKDNNCLVRHVYGRQCMDGSILFGGSRVKCEMDDFEIMSAEMKSNIHYVEHDILPAIGNYNVNRYWCGIMPFSMDGKPLVGELDSIGLNGVWMLCGFGPNGIMEGPGAAKYVADRIVNQLHDVDDIAQSVHPCRATYYINN